MERENLCLVTPMDVKGQAASGSNREARVLKRGTGAEQPVVASKAL